MSRLGWPFVTILIAACGEVTESAPDAGAPLSDADAAEVEVDADADEAVPRLTIAPLAPQIAEGEDVFLTVTHTNADGVTKDVTSEAIWATQDPTIALLRIQGGGMRVRGETPGEVAISVSYADLDEETAVIVEESLEDVELSPRPPTLAVGTTAVIPAMGIRADFSKRRVEADLDWSTADGDVATVTSSGVVEARGAGASSIIGSYRGEVVGSVLVEVTGADVSELTLSNLPGKLPVDGIGMGSAAASFADGHGQDVTADATWEVVAHEPASGNGEAVIEFVDEGIIKGLAEGTATLRAVFGGAESAVHEVEVLPEDLHPISIEPGVVLETVSTHGFPFSISWSGDFGTHGTHGINELISTRSSQPAALQATDDKLYLPVAPSDGPVEIEATLTVEDGDDLVGAAEVEVVDAELSDLELHVAPSEQKLIANGQFGVLALNVTREVYWSSSNPDCAIPDNATAFVVVVDADACEQGDVITGHFRGLEESVPIQDILDAGNG